MPDFNVDLVKLRAEQIVLKSPADIDSARLVYLEEIMDWSEYYTEADQSIQVFEAIINLWIQFASFEQSLNQFKKTVELYDKAIIDPIASKSCKIFKAYITFYINRNKYNNAQKIFIKSLCAGFNEEENRSLWLDYLQMMHRVNKSTVLTLPQLYHAVKSQLNEASGLQLLASLPTECHSIDNNSSTFVKANVSISTGTTTATTTAISSSSRSDSNVSSNRNSSINPINNNTNNSSSSDNSFIDTLSNSKGPDASEVIVAIKTEDITSQFVKPQTEVKVETLDKKEIFNTTTTTTTSTTMNDAVVVVSATVIRNENSRIVTAPQAVVSLNHNNALIKREDRSVSPPPYMLSTTTTTSSLLPSLLSSSSSNASNVLHHIDNINDVVNHNYHDISSSNSSRDINSHIAIDSVVDTGMMISSSSSSHSDHMIIDNVSLDESTMHAILQPTAHPSIDNSMMYASVDDLDDVTGLTPKQIIRIFYARPPMIFTAHYKEPISLGLNVLNEDKRKELERYLSVPFTRLIDYELPSTRQLSGQQQQQQQQQRSSNISINNISNVDDSKWIKVDNVLDLLESLWMIQSLKERHFDSWIRDLRVVHMTNESDLMEVFRKNNESNCSSDEDRKQERKKQQIELERFHSHCNMQQELLFALINKSLFALLIEQQNILSSIGFPSFSTSFIDKLLNHISQLKGNSMVGSTSSSKISFELDGMIVSQLSLQRTLVCALLSVRLRFTIPPITQHHQHLNININDININPLINNNNSINNNSNNNNNNNNEVRHDDNAMKIEHEMHSYNVELRKKRKRRRPFNSHSNNNNSNNNGSSSSNSNSDGLSYYQRQPSSISSSLEQQHQHQRYQHSSLHQSTYQLSSSSSLTSTGIPLVSYHNH